MTDKGESLVDCYRKWRAWADAEVCCDYGLHSLVSWWEEGVTDREMEQLATEEGWRGEEGRGREGRGREGRRGEERRGDGREGRGGEGRGGEGRRGEGSGRCFIRFYHKTDCVMTSF